MNKETEVVTNPNKVPQKQWRKWSAHAKKVFNSTFSWINDNQSLTKHPEAAKQMPKHWRTIAWNAAWIAADGADGQYWSEGKEVEILSPEESEAAEREIDGVA